MYVDEKREIILSEGVHVIITDHVGNTFIKTKALLGKASKQSYSELAHELHRKAHFLPEIEVKNGMVVKNMLTLEQYLVLATMQEGYGREVISSVSRLVVTNAEISVIGLVEVADENGDIFKGEVTKAEHLPVYIQLVNTELKQYQPGQLEKTTYVIYTPAIDYDLLDKIIVNMGGRETNVRISHVDYMTYVGMALLYVTTETRT